MGLTNIDCCDVVNENASMFSEANTATDNASIWLGKIEEFDEPAFVRSYLGWRHRNTGESVTLTVVYLVIMITGLIGNISTCIVIGRNRAMHNPTNCYLFSLALSDLLTLCFGLPPELYAIWEAYPWRFGEPYCLFKAFLTEMTSTASVLTISGFTVERYMAVRHPLRTQATFGLRRAIRTVIAIWLVASVASTPYPLNTRTFYYVSDPRDNRPLTNSFVCNIPSQWMPRMKIVFLVYSIALFVVPMIAITCLYASIGLTLRKRSQFEAIASDAAAVSSPQSAARRAASTATTTSGSRRRRREPQVTTDRKRTTFIRLHSHETNVVFNSCRQAVIRMLVAVVVSFFVCWAPFHVQRVLTSTLDDDQWTPGLLEIQHGFFYVSGVLYYVSATVNPILYNLMSRKFRALFRRTVCRAAASDSHDHSNRRRPPSAACCFCCSFYKTSFSSNVDNDRWHRQPPASRRRPPPFLGRNRNEVDTPDILSPVAGGLSHVTSSPKRMQPLDNASIERLEERSVNARRLPLTLNSRERRLQLLNPKREAGGVIDVSDSVVVCNVPSSTQKCLSISAPGYIGDSSSLRHSLTGSIGRTNPGSMCGLDDDVTPPGSDHDSVIG